MLYVLFAGYAFAYVPKEEVGVQNELPDAVENVGIDENLNSQLPGQLQFKDDNGNQISLNQYLNQDKPVILSLVYYYCPSLCNLHLKGVFDVFSQMQLQPGKDFEFVAVSIDSREDSDLANAKKATYMEEFLNSDATKAQGIHFLTGTEENIKKLAQEVGFKYKWVEENKEWAHASAAIISTPQGKISRYLHGVHFEPKTFRLSVVEASKGVIGTITDSFALFCFRYDPKRINTQYTFLIFCVRRQVYYLYSLACGSYLFG